MPTVSVVVPIHDVEDFLGECLRSLAEQTWTDLEVILVEDSSSDGSRRIAEDFAAGRPGWRVVPIEAGGPGAARNAGIAVATGRYLSFVDADDVVPVDGIERLVTLLEQTGSDIASGMAMRYDGLKTWPSPLQRAAIRETRLRTSIDDVPSLLRDTTVWAKLYRREFWDRVGLTFPEGHLFEDMPVATIAQFEAASVDLLDQPVYWWRIRQSDRQSITQRRTEIANLDDRVLALRTIDEYLRRRPDSGRMKRAHDLKVLRHDFAVHMKALPEADRAFQERFVEVVREYLTTVVPAVLDEIPAHLRLPYHLASRGMVGELVEVMDVARDPARNQLFRRRGLRLYADLPYLFDSSVGVPDSIYDVSRSQPLRTGIADVTWSGDRLVVDGHAYADGSSRRFPWSGICRVQARRIGGSAQRVNQRTRPARRPEVTARVVRQPINYDWSGFISRVDVPALVAASGSLDGDGVDWELLAQVATLSVRKGGRLGCAELQRAPLPRAAFLGDVVAAPRYVENTWLTLQLWRPQVVADQVSLTDGRLSVQARLRPDLSELPLGVRGLGLFRLDALNGIALDLTAGPAGRLEAEIDLRKLGIRDDLVTETDWDLRLMMDDGTPGQRVAAAAGLPDRRWQHGGRMVQTETNDRGALCLRDRAAVPVVTDLTLSRDGLDLAGWLPDGVRLAGVSLQHGDGRTAELTVSQSDRDGDGVRWHASLPADAPAAGPTALRWMHLGRWDAVADLVDDGTGVVRSVPVLARSRVVDEIHGETQVHGVLLWMVVEPTGTLGVQVEDRGPAKIRGPWRARQARRSIYRLARRQPVQDVALFEAWRGKSWADNPQAIYTELRRQHPRQRAVWALTSLATERPRDVEVVVRGSAEYWRLLGRARWVVGNDSLPTSFRRRPGQHYLQTWHGTPLKRLAFDVPDLKIANRNYLREFAVEVAQWTWLISPNPFSSEVMTKAFRYRGPVLETGYPRNDVLSDETAAAERVRAVRARLDLAEDRKVMLYAPTWRDNRFNPNGRYQFDMRLNLERLRHEIGDDWVVLIRGHHILSRDVRISGDLKGFVRNVSTYPDIQDLYLVADAMVTDYSSAMFDYAITGRPMVFFTWDLESYRDELRGFYFDLEQDAPGPLVRTTEEVAAALQDLPALQIAYAERYRRFQERFCALEDGHAAARVVEAVWGGGRPRP